MADTITAQPVGLLTLTAFLPIDRQRPLGAALGAIAAQIGPAPVDNGFELGAASGALLLGAIGLAYEKYRLENAFESKEAGDTNEKLKILALKEKTSLYSDNAVSGYVYFPEKMALSISRLTIPLIRGDPSKDWVPPPQFEKKDYEVYSPLIVGERPKVVDLSPLICKCQVPLDLCPDKYSPYLLKRVPQLIDPNAENLQCVPAASRTDQEAESTCNAIKQGRIVLQRP